MHICRAMSARALPVVFLIFGAAHLRAAVLYDQPTNSFGGFFSQNDTTLGGLGNYATVYDNFTLGATNTIGLVSWVGSYSPPPAGTMTGYTITFYSDAAGAPGGALYTTGDVAGNANETFLLTDSFSNPTFTYSAPVNFTALAGTQYWMSIVADVADPPGWVWESGTGAMAIPTRISWGRSR
jgi:hypothetical protein